MIERLYMRNFAIADELSIQFTQGFNVITGETGAGKSIILNAIAMIMGDRAENTLIRTGEEEALIEAVFSEYAPSLESVLSEKGIAFEDTIIVKRIIKRNGKNAVFINGSQTTLAVLKEIMELLIDLNNQNDHQRLMHAEEHFRFLDAFGDYKQELLDYTHAFIDYRDLVQSYERFRTNEKELMRRLESLRFEYTEITSAAPQPREDELLGEELTMLENAKDLITAAQSISCIVNDDETFSDITAQLMQHVKTLRGFSSDLTAGADTIAEALEQLSDGARQVERNIDALDLDEERRVWVNERLALLEKLKRKYGDSIDEVRAYATSIDKEIKDIETMSFDGHAIQKAIEEKKNVVVTAATRLSGLRATAGYHFKEAVETELAQLGMEKASFSVRFLPCQTGIDVDGAYMNADGPNEPVFYIATNPGEGEYPFSSIASGGELSRVLFAIKTITGRKYNLGTLIFDEIDTGIGGDTARKLGLKLLRLSRDAQTILITHQPQIASLADSHYYVEKIDVDGRTVSRVRHLTTQEHVDEIARMIGGTAITEFTRKTAEELCVKE